MKPEVAQRRIAAFRDRFGEAHYHFVCHAAFPLALTPDLMYRLWANFQRDVQGESLEIPWMAVADVLLSSLCEEVGHELYEMPLPMRNALLSELKTNSRFGIARINELSDLLLMYVQQQLESPDSDERDIAQAQRWTALAYTQPSKAAKEIASTLATLQLNEKAEWIRMTSLVETFAEPLAHLQPLLTYTRGMANFVRGRVDAAASDFALLSKQTSLLDAVEVDLPIPKLTRERSQQFQNPSKIGSVNIEDLYSAFDFFSPLTANHPSYIDCKAVRGGSDILVELGRTIQRSSQPTCQIYTGYRGVGKSTELLRLKADLESKGCRVVYFAADNDIDTEDAHYPDILLSCTRHILEDLKDQANPLPLTNWLKSRWQVFRDLALTEIKFEDLKIEQQISQFMKLTATLRQVPNTRQKIRNQVDSHSIALIQALNEFIAEVMQKLAAKKLVVILDNLDRIVPTPRSGERTNYDEIFIDRSNQLRGLNCHIIYTAPISLVYSNRAVVLRDTYGDCRVLPMVTVNTQDNQVYQPGIEKLKHIVQSRIANVATEEKLSLAEVFDHSDTLARLCLMSGGYIRQLLMLIRSCLTHTDCLPISAEIAQRAIAEARDTYRRIVSDEDWSILVEVSRTKKIRHNEIDRMLLFKRLVMEYRSSDEELWYDVHPLLKDAEQFKAISIDTQ